MKHNQEWVVYCEWCDKAIVKGVERITNKYGHFCQSYCWWNYDDCYNNND